MSKVFEAYIAKANSPSEAFARLWLPAQPYELFDALDKVRLGDAAMYIEVNDFAAYGYLAPYISVDCNLLELNALAQKLSELDEWQSESFEGLVKMDVEKKDGSITMPRLIDLAYSADCCHFIPDVRSDAQLGKFYVDNDFCPELDTLPESIYELLDYAKIGRDQRIAEGGVFTANGYVLQDTELVEAFKDMELTVRTPEYEILLELSDGSRMQLPRDTIPDNVVHTCLDCRVPSLMAAIDAADIHDVAKFAAMLKPMGDKTMLKYKAMLEATGCDSLEDATALAAQLDEYVFEGRISSERELAMDELKFMMSDEDAELLSGFTDLYGYGRAILLRDNSTITPYGLVERTDHQPMQTQSEQMDQGMEMM